MLVLRRKAGEAIVLNGVITIYVLAVEGERVKLGISAPPEVVIVRSELLDAPTGIPGGPGASTPGAVAGPMLTRPTPPPQRESGPDFGRIPPERPYREPERPYRQPDSPSQPEGGPTNLRPDQSGSFNSPARYTPRRRYDNYGEEVDAPVPGSPDTFRYR